VKFCWCTLGSYDSEKCKDCSNYTGDIYRCKFPTFIPKVPFPTEFQPFKTGWICPKCGRVLAPNMPFCLWCNKEHKEDIKSN
jgi:hypothetical protein